MRDQAQCQAQPITDSTGCDDGERVHEIATRTLIKHYIGRHNGLHGKDHWNAPSGISLSPAPAISQHFDSHGFPPSRRRQNGIIQYISKWLA